MTVTKLCLERCLPNGIRTNCSTPCATFNFAPDVIKETFQIKLPQYVAQLNAAFNNVPLGQVSGLAPTGQGGPFDKCIINGVWNAEQQAAHGGPIPMLSGAPGSRGIPDVWPYFQPKFAESNFENQKKTILVISGSLNSQDGPT